MKPKVSLASSTSILIGAVIAILALLRGTPQTVLLLLTFALWGLWVVLTLLRPSWRANRDYAEDVRVLNKIIRETRKKGLDLMNDDIDMEDIQGELETRCKFLFEPLQRMIDAKEISAAEIILMDGHEETFIEDETMRTKIRYLSRGYIREVYINLARRRPTA